MTQQHFVLKVGNVCVLKGGKEAEHSNKGNCSCIKRSISKNKLPEQAISLLPDSTKRRSSKTYKTR